MDDFADYKKKIQSEYANVPIEVLCLPKVINTILKKNNIYRVFDLLGIDIKGIKWISDNRARIINKQLIIFGIDAG